ATGSRTCDDPPAGARPQHHRSGEQRDNQRSRRYLDADVARWAPICKAWASLAPRVLVPTGRTHTQAAAPRARRPFRIPVVNERADRFPARGVRPSSRPSPAHGPGPTETNCGGAGFVEPTVLPYSSTPMSGALPVTAPSATPAPAAYLQAGVNVIADDV